MEFTKQALMALGLSEEVATKVLDAHKDVLKDSYVPIHRFNEVNEANNLNKTELARRDAELTELKKFKGTAEELTAKVAKMEEENATQKAQYEATLKTQQEDMALKQSLTSMKGKPHDVEIVLNQIDKTKIVFKDGAIVSGLNEQVAELRKNKSFLFESVEGSKGGNFFNIKGKNENGEDGGSEDGTDDSVSFAKSLAKSKADSAKTATAANDAYFTIK